MDAITKTKEHKILIIVLALLVFVGGGITILMILLNSNNSKVLLEFTGAKFSNKTVVYDGGEHNLLVTDVPSGTTVLYTNNIHVDAGIYEATATLSKEGYNQKTLEATLIIDKAIINLNNVTFEDGEFTYNKAPIMLLIGGELPDTALVTYTNNYRTDVGEYDVIANFSPKDPKNYEVNIKKLEAKLTINKATITEISISDSVFTYDDTPKSLEIKDIPTDINVSYTYNGTNTTFISETNVGTYKIDVTLSSSNYERLVITANLTIEKAFVNLNGLSFSNVTTTFDGTVKELIIVGTIPDQVNVVYENNAHIDVGIYATKVLFTLKDSHNYILDITEMMAVLTINKGIINGVSFSDHEVTYDGMIHVIEAQGIPLGVSVTYTNSGTINEFLGESNSGIYNVDAVFIGSNYHDLVLSASLTIKKAIINLNGLKFNDMTAEYDGMEKVITISGNVPNSINIEYINNANTNASTYIARAKITPKDTTNFDVNKRELRAILTITAKVIDVNGVVFTSITSVYDGMAKEIIATNVPELIRVDYVDNNKTDAGIYLAKAIFTANNINFKPSINFITATLTINKALLLGAELNDSMVIADGTNKMIYVEGTENLPEEIKITYTVDGVVFTGATIAGLYKVTATLEKVNYETVVLRASLLIDAEPTVGLLFTLINEGTEYMVNKGTSTDTEINIPLYYNGKNVTKINESTFSGHTYNLTSLIFPSTITEIDLTIFHNCYNLSLIRVIDGENSNKTYMSNSNCLIRISDNTLVLGCKNSIIPNYIAEIGDYAFFGSAIQGELALPESIVDIGVSAFNGCHMLTGTLVLPSNLVHIGEGAFMGCTQITKIIMSNSVVSIGSSAFYMCVHLEEIDYEGTVAEWENIIKEPDAFYESEPVHCTDGEILT